MRLEIESLREQVYKLQSEDMSEILGIAQTNLYSQKRKHQEYKSLIINVKNSSISIKNCRKSKKDERRSYNFETANYRTIQSF